VILTRLASLGADPPLDPSADQGQELLRTELRKLPYGEHRSVLQRLQDWISAQLARAAESGASEIGKIVLLLAAIAMVVIVAYAARHVRAGQRARLSTDEAVLTDPARSAADYRRSAAAADAAGDHAAALLDWFRALARAGEERDLLDPRPGQTAHELAITLGASFPEDAVALRVAGDEFDAVRYGGQRADATASARMRDLDQTLQARRPVQSGPVQKQDLVAPGQAR